MLDLSTLAVFMAAVMVLLIVPGPAVLYIVARSVEQGRLAGVVSAAGISIGTLIHTGAAALGLSAILMSSAMAFTVIKYLGAGYLIYLSIRAFLSARTESEQEETFYINPQPLPHIFRQGILVNVLNPKVALFFLAFVPQFADADRGSVGLQVLFLGLILTTMGFISDSMYAVLAGTVRNWLRNSRRAARIQQYLSGSVYLLLGLTTALASE